MALTDALNSYLKYAMGKHGTPDWNPTPHPEADPELVAKRDSDPLWQYHRNLRDYSGDMPKGPTWPEGPGGEMVVHPATVDNWDKPLTLPTPPHFLTGTEAGNRWRAHQMGENTDADLMLSTSGDGFGLTNLNEVDNPNHSNVRAQRLLWDFHGSGRRPWYKTIFSLQSLRQSAAPHDLYRLLSDSLKSGNRHALPALIDLLKRRDNPAGWYKGWAALAKAMNERIGDLPLADTLRRAGAIAKFTAHHSADPDQHQALAEKAAESGDPINYAVLADHMDENGLPQYAQLMRLELAGQMPEFRKTFDRKGSRL